LDNWCRAEKCTMKTAVTDIDDDMFNDNSCNLI